MHLLGVYSTCLYSIGSSAACQQSASRLKCENCETQRKRGEQESSRGHKFSILENFLSIRDFTSSTHVSFRSALVGACLPQTLLERVRQTGIYSPLKTNLLFLLEIREYHYLDMDCNYEDCNQTLLMILFCYPVSIQLKIFRQILQHFHYSFCF